MSGIQAEGLTKRFGSLVAVNHLDFSVNGGEVFGLLGPNGAGKTTTIRVLACMLSPSEGSAQVAGYDIRNDSVKVRRSVGILTENPSLYERLSAVENLEFFAQAYGLKNRQTVRARIKELLDFLELEERGNEKVGTYSKGMKQKLAIARAIMHDPPVLFLDEPTAGLDPEAAKSVRDLIRQLSLREKHTVLLSTHHLEDAERLCGRVMIINKGVNRVVGTPEELRLKIAGHPKLELKLRELEESMIQRVYQLDSVREVQTVDIDGFKGLLVEADDIESIAPQIVRTLVEAGGLIIGVNVLIPPLEEAYLRLVRET